MESISKRGLANEVNGLSVLCLRWKSLKTEDANGLPIFDQGRRSESAPCLKYSPASRPCDLCTFEE
jgi:hypothetical protein